MPYLASLHALSAKPLGISQATPTDARSFFYDTSLFKYRPYQNTAEVLAYLTTATMRTGKFSIFIHSGTLDGSGNFSGGEVTEYWFKEGTADIDLIVKTVDTSGLVQSADAGQRFQVVKDATEAMPSTSPGSIIELTDGRLMIVYSTFTTSIDEEPAVSRTYKAFSTDGGKTWTDEDTIFDIAFENPDGVGGGSLFRSPDGNLHLMVYKLILGVSTFYQTTSTDEGDTWSTPVLKFTTGYVANKTDVALVASNNTIWIPYNIGDGNPSPTGLYDGKLMKSTNNAVTWTDAGVTFESPSGLCVENGILEVEGTLIHYCRDRGGTMTLWNSTDGLTGAAWSSPYSSRLVTPNSMVTMKYDSNNKMFIAVHNEVFRGDISNAVVARLRLMISVSYRYPLNWEAVHLVDEEEEFHFAGSILFQHANKVIVAYYAGEGPPLGVDFTFDTRQKIIPIETLLPSGKRIYGKVHARGMAHWWHDVTPSFEEVELFQADVWNAPNGYYKINNHINNLDGAGFAPVIRMSSENSQYGATYNVNAPGLTNPIPFIATYFHKAGVAPSPTGSYHAVRRDIMGADDSGIASFTTYANGKLELRNPYLGNNPLTFNFLEDGTAYVQNNHNSNLSFYVFGGLALAIKPTMVANLSTIPAATTDTDKFIVSDGGDLKFRTGAEVLSDISAISALQNAVVLDFGSTPAQSSTDLTITVTGAAVDDPVSLSVDPASVVANTSYTAWVSAADTVTVRHNNHSAISSDPASGTFNVFVFK